MTHGVHLVLGAESSVVVCSENVAARPGVLPAEGWSGWALGVLDRWCGDER